MRTFAEKPKATHQTNSAKSTISGPVHSGQNHVVNSILYLQRTIGNQAVQRMLQIDAKNSEAYLNRPVPGFERDSRQIPLPSPATRAIQAKLAVSEPGDNYEQEAGQVSEQVRRIPETRIQRACACSGESDDTSCDVCKLSRKASGKPAGGKHAPAIVGDVLRSAGRPLDAATQTSMDARFNFDFSRVRLHDDARAADSASAVSAVAYTLGNHVVFGRGQYSPATASGRRLLAHELTHVVQQHASGSTATQPFSIGRAHSPAEHEADAIAEAVAANKPLSPISGTSGAQLHCKRLSGTEPKERILDLGSAKALACCDTNACVVDTGGFDCSGFDCAKETGDPSAKNNSLKQPGSKFAPRLKCDAPKCSQDFKPSYSGTELYVAMPSGRRRKGKDQCGQTLGLCANGKSVEVTVREFSNRNTWEASPGVASSLGVVPDFRGSIYEKDNDPDMKDDRNCTPKPKPSPPKPKAPPTKPEGKEK